MRYLSITLFFFILYLQVAFGQSSKIEFSGFARLDHFSTFKFYKPPIINERNQGILQTDVSKIFFDKLKLFASVEFRGDLSDHSRNRIYPIEYYADLSLKSFDLRLGKQKYFWGRADGVNFTNNICPVDYTDFLDIDDEEIGQLSLSGKYYLKDWTFQGVYIPLFSESILPVQNSIWNLPLPSAIPNPYGGFFMPVYNFLPDNIPADNFKNGQFAFKIDKQVSGVDLSTSYYHGYSHLPEFFKTTNLLSLSTIQVNIQKNYFPKDIIGIDFATTLDKIGIRGEGAYFLTSGKEAKLTGFNNDYLQYAVGTDYRKEFSNNNLYFILQWIQEIVPSENKYPVTSFNHIFQKCLLARAEFDSRSIFTFSVQILYDFEEKDYYLQPQFKYKIADGLEFRLLADILDGDDNSLFGIYRDNDRFQMKLKYYF